MASEKNAEWSCKYCDEVAKGEPKWWPTIEKTSKFETSAGVCKPCFRLLASQLKFDNKVVKRSISAKRAKLVKRRTVKK